MSHTPGDWKVDKAIRLGYSIIAISPDGISVVVENIDNEGRYGAIGESDDALLIAAAPDMLEALETIMDIGDKACRDIARAAIRKARGEDA